MADIHNKSIFIFDLDGTLAPSKSNLEPETAVIISKLLKKKKIAVISGGGFEQFNKQFLAHLPLSESEKHNLFLLPATGTQMYKWNGAEWSREYTEENIPYAEKERIIHSIHVAVAESGLETPKILYGNQIEDRGTQITFSGLGQNASVANKSLWDPTRAKRAKIIEILKGLIPEYPIHMGGLTSIDIGWDKGRALEKFIQVLGIQKSEILFFGDALYPEGNDFPAQEIGLECIMVKDPADTREQLRNMLK